MTTTKTCPIIYQYVYIELSVSGFNVTIMNNNDYKLEVYGLANIISGKKRIMHHYMIPGSKGHKSDASLLAGGFLNLGPAKNMSKKPFFEEK